MGKILPVLLAAIGLGAGVGGGLFLRPPPEVVEINPCGDGEPVDSAENSDAPDTDESESDSEFVKINNQFVIPVVQEEKVISLVVMSLNLEVSPGSREEVYLREPKLRDEFLQVMFNHANTGGFDGVFTQSSRLAELRRALKEVSISILGDIARDVLVTNIVRQDV